MVYPVQFLYCNALTLFWWFVVTPSTYNCLEGMILNEHLRLYVVFIFLLFLSGDVQH